MIYPRGQESNYPRWFHWFWQLILKKKKKKKKVQKVNESMVTGLGGERGPRNIQQRWKGRERFARCFIFRDMPRIITFVRQLAWNVQFMAVAGHHFFLQKPRPASWEESVRGPLQTPAADLDPRLLSPDSRWVSCLLRGCHLLWVCCLPVESPGSLETPVQGGAPPQVGSGSTGGCEVI